MMFFKSKNKWYPIDIRHYNTLFYNGKVIRIQGKEYEGPSPELEDALKKERLWTALTKKIK